MNDITRTDGDNCKIDYSSKENLDENEKEFFKGLSPIFNTLQEIQPAELYTFVFKPDGSIIKKNPDGSFIPVYKGEHGKITGPAILKELKTDFFKIGKTIASQSLLLYISFQLNDVLKKLDSMYQQFEIDRIAAIKGVFKTAEDHKYKYYQQSAYTNAEEKLWQAIYALKEGKEFKKKLEHIPKANAGVFENWLGDKNKKNEKYISEMKLDLYWIMKAYYCLIKLYEAEKLAFETESDTRDILEEMKSFFASIDCDALINCSRSLPYNEKEPPENFWKGVKFLKDEIPIKIKEKENIEKNCNSFVLQLRGEQIQDLCMKRTAV